MRSITSLEKQPFLFGILGSLALLAMLWQPAQAREGDGDASGLSVQATTDLPLTGLEIDLTAAQVDELDSAAFDETDQVLSLDALSGTVTADVITAHTQHQPFLNQIDADAATANLAILLNLLGISLVDLSSTTIDSDAQVTGSCGAFTASGGASIEGLTLNVLGESVAAGLTATPAPNTELLNTVININLGASTLSANALVILNEQTVAGDQSAIAVNALRISLDITVTGLVSLAQTVDITISHSDAGLVNCNDVDLSVNVTTSLGGGNATVGVPYDYIVTVTETSGNADANAVQFTDTLPNEVTFVSFINQGGGSCSHDGTNPGGTITCQWPTVPAGGNVAATYRVNPDTATAPASVSNNVIATTADNDTDPSDNTGSVAVTIDAAGGTTTDLGASFANATPTDGQVGVAQTVEINVTNTGALATNATLVYTVSPDATIGTITDPIFGNCVATGNTVNCGPTDLSDSTNATLQIPVTPTTSGSNTHTVNVTSDVPDSSAANNTDEATVNVIAAASNVDLQVTVTDTPDPAAEGESITYTIDIDNNGTEDANNVMLDVSLTGVPVSIDSATPDQGSCTPSGSTVSCDLGTIPASGNTTVTIIVSPSGTGTLVLGGTVEDDASNSAPVSASTTIAAASADLGITMLSDVPEITLGSQVTHFLTVTNHGPDTANNIVTDVTLPSQLTFISATPSAGSCSELSGAITCNLSTLANSDVLSITLVARAFSPGPTTTTAFVNSITDDPDMANNSASVSGYAAGVGDKKSIPTLSEYGLMLMMILMALLVVRNQTGTRRR